MISDHNIGYGEKWSNPLQAENEKNMPRAENLTKAEISGRAEIMAWGISRYRLYNEKIGIIEVTIVL